MLYAGTTAERKVRALRTGLSRVHRCQEEQALMCLSVTWEYSECPCLSLHLQNIYRVSETTVPPCPPTHTTACLASFTYGITFICMGGCLWIHIPQQAHLVEVASLYTGGSWGLNWGLVAPLNHLDSPSSSNVFSSNQLDHYSLTRLAFCFSIWSDNKVCFHMTITSPLQKSLEVYPSRT